MKWPNNLERGPRTSGNKRGHNKGKKRERDPLWLYAVVFLDTESDAPWAEVLTFWAESYDHAREQAEPYGRSSGRITQVRLIPEAGER